MRKPKRLDVDLRLTLTGFTYALLLAGVTILYVAIGTWIIYRQAPKTFKIKA